MEKITTIEQQPQSDHLIIRYVFTLSVPSELATKEGSETRKITGETHWQHGTDAKKIKEDLERRYAQKQKELEEEVSPTASYKMSYDGETWLNNEVITK